MPAANAPFVEWPDQRFEYLAHIAQRMGRGHGCHSYRKYKPWRTFRTMSRSGTTRIIECSRTGRQITLPSCAHKVYFMLQERRAGVASVEENFPLLNMEQTLEISAKLGVQHPQRNGLPEPLTLSFLVREVRAGKEIVYGRSISAESVEAKEQATQLDVMREACAALRIDWAVVDPTPLDETMLNSLVFARGWIGQRHQPDKDATSSLKKWFHRHHKRTLTLKEVLVECSASMDVTIAAATALFRYAAWTGSISVDFRHELALNRVVHLLKDG